MVSIRLPHMQTLCPTYCAPLHLQLIAAHLTNTQDRSTVPNSAKEGIVYSTPIVTRHTSILSILADMTQQP